MLYVMILSASIFLTNVSVAMDLEEKLRQDAREYWDELNEDDKSNKDKSIESRMRERDEENRIIAMIAAHVAKL